MIVKVQIPLAGDLSQALVYNQSRTLNQQIPMSEDVRRLMGERPKVFFEAAVNESSALVLGREVPDPGW